MIDAQLSQLLSLSSAMDAPKRERVAKADTKKNRMALGEACVRRDIDELRRLIDLGAPLSIRVEERHASSGITPLSICARQDWAAGLQALLDAGASEDGLLKEAIDNRAAERNCLDVAAAAGSREAFAILLPLHAAETRSAAAAKTTEPALYLAAERLGFGEAFGKERLSEMAKQCLPALDPSVEAAAEDSAKSAERARAFDSIALRLDFAHDPATVARLWIEALRSRGPGPLQGMATRGLAPSKDGSIELIPAKAMGPTRAPSHWAECRKAPVSWDPARVEWKFLPAASAPIRVGLATAAAMVETPNHGFRSLLALCAIPALRDELMANPLGLHYLTRVAEPKVFQRLAASGADLSLVVDESQLNPLHRAIQAEASKGTLEALAKCCPGWISQRDAQNRVPTDLVSAKAKISAASLALMFDQIGMRDALKGRQGSRHVPAKTRRL